MALQGALARAAGAIRHLTVAPRVHRLATFLVVALVGPQQPMRRSFVTPGRRFSQS